MSQQLRIVLATTRGFCLLFVPAEVHASGDVPNEDGVMKLQVDDAPAQVLVQSPALVLQRRLAP
jgi:hypothetical protein